MYYSTNPSVVRSQNLLTEALLKRMRIKTYSEITITELVEAAELTRKTFYRNFNSKDEIIERQMDIIFQEYLSGLEQLENFEVYTVLLTYFDVCERHKSFLLLMLQQNLSLIFYTKYQEYLKIIEQRFQKNSAHSASRVRYHIAFSAGGFFQVMQLWLKNGLQETPEEMANLCVSFLLPEDDGLQQHEDKEV